MIYTLGIRVLEIICAAIVLGLSIVELKGYGPGNAPSIYAYGAFCGGAAIAIAAIGVTACFIETLQGRIMIALDAFASFFLLAGGIAMAITFKIGNCTDWNVPSGYMLEHSKPFKPSSSKTYDTLHEKKAAKMLKDDITSRCQMAQAETAFVWFAFACAVGALAISFLVKRRGPSSIV